jgi:hypothetical protein
MLSAVSKLTERLGLSQPSTAPNLSQQLTAPVADDRRSLSPTIFKKKKRERKLSPMAKNFKKTLHVNHISL